MSLASSPARGCCIPDHPAALCQLPASCLCHLSPKTPTLTPGSYPQAPEAEPYSLAMPHLGGGGAGEAHEAQAHAQLDQLLPVAVLLAAQLLVHLLPAISASSGFDDRR